MKRILPITILLCLAMGTSLRAQDTFGMFYSINFTTGNTNDFISKTSFRGFTFDYRHHIRPELSVGLSSGWYAFYERKDNDTYSISEEQLSFSGIQYRYLNSAPLLVIVDYHLTPEELISPFAGLGIGTTYNRVNVTMGLYETKESSWHFTLAPEIGVQVGRGSSLETWGFISARYNYNFSTSDLDTQGYITLNIGFMYGI